MLSKETCAQCAFKHLGQARALAFEFLKGYLDHYGKAIGHMAEAEDHLIRHWPALALEIREHRTHWLSDLVYETPFDDLMMKVLTETGFGFTQDDVLQMLITKKETDHGQIHSTTA